MATAGLASDQTHSATDMPKRLPVMNDHEDPRL